MNSVVVSLCETKFPLAVLNLLSQRPFASEDVVVVLGEAVGFVADILQEAQRVRAALFVEAALRVLAYAIRR